MRIPQAKEYLKRMMFARVQGKPVSVLMTSAPGVGKSQLVDKVVNEVSTTAKIPVGLLTLIMSSLAPEDFMGLPYNEQGEVKFARPVWMPPAESPEFGVVFIDEFTQNREDLQKPAAQLSLESKINCWELPKGWVVWMAGNRLEDRAGVVKLLSHLPNRLSIIEIDFHIDDYTSFLHQQKVHPLFIGLANHRPDLLTSFRPDQQLNCTPRSYHRAAELYPLFENDLYLQNEMFASMVGRGTAAEISGYMRIYKELPQFEEIVKDPSKAKMPSENPAALWGIIAMLAAKVTAETWPPVARYIGRVPEEMRANAVLGCIRRHPKLVETPEWGEWIKNNAAIMSKIAQIARSMA